MADQMFDPARHLPGVAAFHAQQNAPAPQPGQNPPGAPWVARAPADARVSNEAQQQATTLGASMVDETPAPAPAPQPTQQPPSPGEATAGDQPRHAGEAPETGPDADKEKPAKGSRDAELARLKEESEALTPEQRQARIAQLQSDMQLYSSENVTKDTKDLSPEDAARQRISDARKKLIELEALGLSPAEAKKHVDPRILSEVDAQQKMVDDLAGKNAGLTEEQQELADLARQQREAMRENPGSVSKEQHAALIERMGGQQALDAMPAEVRLLMHGFSPDEIADHFTARDKDADVIQDPNDPAANTDKRGEGALKDTFNADGSVKSKFTGGDRNDNAMNGDGGTVRRPMTAAEADLAIDINAVLDESWHAGNKFGKVVPQTTVGNLQTGKDTWRDQAGVAGGGTRTPALTGDLGELANTEREADPAKRGAAQIAAAGLDYPTSPFVERDADGKLVPKADPVHRVEGTINTELQNNAEVQVGHGVMARAQQRSKELAAAQAANPEAFVPKMLRRGSSEGDPADADDMPGISERSRMGKTDETVQADPRTGLGYSVTETADMGTVPNQERKMKSAMGYDKIDGGVNVTRSDRPGEVDMSFDKPSGTFKPAAGLPADVGNDYAERKAESEQRLAEIAERKRAEEEAARRAAEAARAGSNPTGGPGSA